jgi:hypothetical protein
MPETVNQAEPSHARLSNPLLDLTIAGLEAQLKAWQAYQVEGTLFIAKRLHANLELFRGFGHCRESEHVGACHKAWVSAAQADYAEEWGRLVATTPSRSALPTSPRWDCCSARARPGSGQTCSPSSKAGSRRPRPRSLRPSCKRLPELRFCCKGLPKHRRRLARSSFRHSNPDLSRNAKCRK